ncbi:MAG: DUF4124 domain-containing protein [Pseudomarimonas sp.]
MNKPICTLTLIIASLLLVPSADAQKLYRWVDKDGKVHYSDTVPPSEAGKARDELNRQGRTVGSVTRAMTPEEQAAADAAVKTEEAKRKAREAEEHMDSVLLSSYEQEIDLTRAYDERFDLVKQSIESARVGIRSQENSLAEMLAHAADLERGGKPISESVKSQIAISRKQVAEQADYLRKREAEQSVLQKEYDETLARYRRLKAAREAATAEKSKAK